MEKVEKRTNKKYEPPTIRDLREPALKGQFPNPLGPQSPMDPLPLQTCAGGGSAVDCPGGF
jgi:hypothetical protein